MTYPPGKDSYMLKDRVQKLDLEDRKVLDLGTGSGIIAVAAAEKGAEVLATDIDSNALKDAKIKAEKEGVEERIKFRQSDLFQDIEESFDYIFFNPPYLPGEEYRELEGGEEGVEITEKFLEEARKHLKEEGAIYFIASSKSDVDRLKQDFDLEEVETKKLWFETLYLFKSD